MMTGTEPQTLVATPNTEELLEAAPEASVTDALEGTSTS